MPTENETTQEVQNTENANGVTSQPSEQPVSNGKGSGNILTIPAASMATLKQAERERGRKKALAELEEQAKASGFASFEEMRQFAAAAKSRNAGNSQAESRGRAQGNDSRENGESREAGRRRDQRPAGNRDEQKRARVRQALEDRAKELQRAKAREEKRSRELRRQLDEKDTEIALREIAMRKGVTDVDIGLFLLRRAAPVRAEGEDTKAYHARLAAFKADEYFDKLRESHPYLFGETVRPVTTGNNGAKSPPSPPSPKKVQTEVANNGTPDARSLTQEQYRARLAELGLNG